MVVPEAVAPTHVRSLEVELHIAMGQEIEKAEAHAVGGGLGNLPIGPHLGESATGEDLGHLVDPK
jgi:hypothetical protein